MYETGFMTDTSPSLGRLWLSMLVNFALRAFNKNIKGSHTWGGLEPTITLKPCVAFEVGETFVRTTSPYLSGANNTLVLK